MAGSVLMKHTPGPWTAKPFRLVMGQQQGPLMSYLVGNKASTPGMVVSVASERIADHHLCAAAPDLLQCLSDLVAFVRNTEAFGHVADSGILAAGEAKVDMDRINAVIAKATQADAALGDSK